jgi:hypothetical protein
MRGLLHEYEVGSKAKKYGGAAAAGGLVVLAAVGKAKLEAKAAERAEYVKRTMELLTGAQKEIVLTSGMTPRASGRSSGPASCGSLGHLERYGPRIPRFRSGISTSSRILRAWYGSSTTPPRSSNAETRAATSAPSNV